MSGEHDTERFGPRQRHGSPTFYELLEKMAKLHDEKSHDYASNDNPSGNYHFAGMLSKLFDNSDDAGFIGRIGEKLYRLANLENGGKIARNESVEDTEKDICVITVLWMADRINRRKPKDIFYGGSCGGNKDIPNPKENAKLRSETTLNMDDRFDPPRYFDKGSPAEKAFLESTFQQIANRCDLLPASMLYKLSTTIAHLAHTKSKSDGIAEYEGPSKRNSQ